MITYQVEPDLGKEEFTAVLASSTLGERRPIDDPERIAAMLRYAGLILTARDNGKLIGVARSLTDFSYCTYLSDLAVDKAYQRKGVGKELIRRTKNETPAAKLILLSAPQATTYYPRIGMTRFEQCYVLDDAADLKGV